MSKKNKNKRRLLESSEISAVASEAVAEKPGAKADDDLKREFKHLARTILFILALLTVIYYYDQQFHILQSFTDQLLGLF